MEELGLTVIAVNPEDQTKLFETIDMISTAADVVEKGQELEYWISDALESLKKSLDGVETPSVYLAGNSALLQTAGRRCTVHPDRERRPRERGFRHH